MPWDVFYKRMLSIAEKSGISLLGTSCDDKGKYIARFSDDTVITGNSISLKLTVKFGSGHMAMC